MFVYFMAAAESMVNDQPESIAGLSHLDDWLGLPLHLSSAAAIS